MLNISAAAHYKNLQHITGKSFQYVYVVIWLLGCWSALYLLVGFQKSPWITRVISNNTEHHRNLSDIKFFMKMSGLLTFTITNLWTALGYVKFNVDKYFFISYIRCKIFHMFICPTGSSYPSPPPGFWNGVDWRLLVRDQCSKIAKLRG